MKKFLLLLSTVSCLLALTLAFEGTAQAYADPGSGLMALQVIGSTLTGVAFYFRHKLGMFFANRKQAVPETGNDVPTTHDKPAQ